MAELKLKDFVDDKSLKELKDLDSTLASLRESYKEAFKELQKGLDIEVKVKGDVDKIEDLLKVQINKVNSTSKEVNETLQKQAEVAGRLMRTIEEKSKAEKLSIKEAKELARATNETTKALHQGIKAEQTLNKTKKAAKLTEEERLKVIKAAIALTEKEVHSIDEATQANKELRQAVKLVKDTDEDCTDVLKKLNSAIGNNTDLIKRNSDKYTQQKMNIGNYKEDIKDAYSELQNLNGVMDSFGISTGRFGDSLQRLGEGAQFISGNGLKGLTSLLKNKWILGLGAASGVAAGAAWWVNYNKGLTEATRLTQTFTQKSGDELKKYRTQVQSLSDVYEKDFKEVMISVNALSKQFGIDQDEALQKVKDGFIAGADANGEYLDILREYPAYFREAGLSAEAFIAITAQAAKSGIYSDKGVDVIKEGNIRIREMTKATAEALEGIGISADEVQSQLEKGEKTTFDIMQMVSEKLSELPEASSEVGTALADIFGGPGEDAGLQYIKTLKDIKTNLKEVKKATGEVGQAQEDLLAAQTKLSTEVALLFDATGGAFETMSAKVKTFFNDALAGALSGIRQLISSAEELGGVKVSAARDQGKEQGLENVKKEYAAIDKAREEYVKKGLSQEEALKKAKEERIAALQKALEKEEELLKKSYELNQRYAQEKEDSHLGTMITGVSRAPWNINKDLDKSMADIQLHESSSSFLKTMINGVEDYNPLKKAAPKTKPVVENSGGTTATSSTVETHKEEAEQMVSTQEEVAERMIGIISEEAATEQVVRNASYINQMSDLKQAYANKEMNEEEYNKRKGDLTKKYEDETLQAVIDSLKAQLDVEDLTAEDREKISAKLQKAQADLADKQANDSIKAMEEEEAKAKKIAEEKKRRQEEYKALAMETLSQLTELTAAFADRKIEKIEEEQEALNEAYEADVERITALEEQGVISREEAEERKRAAADKTAAENEKLEKKKAAIARKQAIFEKSVQIAQTGMATARGIMEAMGMLPPNPILAGIIAAMGAVQVATIAATPIPRYAKGTNEGGHSGGLAVVGDGGKPELVMYGDKAWITPDTPTLVDLPRGAEVLPDIERMDWSTIQDDSYLRDRDGNNIIVVDTQSAELLQQMGKLHKVMTATQQAIMKQTAIQHRDAYNARYEQYIKSNL